MTTLSENLQNIPVGLSRKPITTSKSNTDISTTFANLTNNKRKTSDSYLEELNSLIATHNIKKDEETASKITDMWFLSQANMELNSERKNPAYLALYLKYCQWIG